MYRFDKHVKYNNYNNQQLIHFDDLSKSNIRVLYDYIKSVSDAGGPIVVDVKFG